MNKRMIAQARILQNGVPLKAEDPFECNEQDAADLVSMQLARYAEVVEEEKPRRTYRRRDMTAQ